MKEFDFVNLVHVILRVLVSKTFKLCSKWNNLTTNYLECNCTVCGKLYSVCTHVTVHQCTHVQLWKFCFLEPKFFDNGNALYINCVSYLYLKEDDLKYRHEARYV